MEITLSNIQPGKIYRIKHIKPSPIRLRLVEMGIMKDAEIEMIRAAPLKDPLEFKVRNYFVGLRRSEASIVIVESVS